MDLGLHNPPINWGANYGGWDQGACPGAPGFHFAQKGEGCPGALPIDRDFAEDFTAFKSGAGMTRESVGVLEQLQFGGGRLLRAVGWFGI